MESLKEALKNKLINAGRIALLGIGSELRGDDAAGVKAAVKLKILEKKRKNAFRVFEGFDAPENLTGEIKSYNPTHLIIIDTLDAGKIPGAISLVNPEDIEGISFSTHRMPLNIFTNYLEKSTGCKIIIAGIQPESLEPMQKLTKRVSKAVKEIVKIIKDVILSL